MKVFFEIGANEGGIQAILEDILCILV